MFDLRIQPEAKADIKAMIEQGGDAQKAAIRILAFLQELASNGSWREELLTRKFENTDFNVDKFVECWNDGMDIWRVTVFEFAFPSHKIFKLPYRVLYALDLQSKCFRILAVAHRDFDYKADHEITLRIQHQYDDLGLQRTRVHAPAGRYRDKHH